MTTPLPREFFTRDPIGCARELIGCRLVWGECAGVIVETEAYCAENDEASHTWSRPSARAFVAAHPPGAAYVYFNYGMYWMLNVLVKGQADGFVLFRAVEPTAGLAAMRQRREAARRPGNRPMLDTALCSGPGKLAQAFGITGADHGRDFCAGGPIGFYPAKVPIKATADVRIGISRAQHFPWRFLHAESAHVSVRIKRK